MDSGNKFAVIAVGVLILINAIGNARVMFVVSTLGLLFGLALLRKNSNESSVLAVTLGFFLTMIIAIIIWISK